MALPGVWSPFLLPQPTVLRQIFASCSFDHLPHSRNSKGAGTVSGHIWAPKCPSPSGWGVESHQQLMLSGYGQTAGLPEEHRRGPGLVTVCAQVMAPGTDLLLHVRCSHSPVLTAGPRLTSLPELHLGEIQVVVGFPASAWARGGSCLCSVPGVVHVRASSRRVTVTGYARSIFSSLAPCNPQQCSGLCLCTLK
ncbi:uncharacterized protein LOC123625462 isoform X2 [Lemur catta]|uniref:uncharacterized protein LOC123625462 isoform X2 n=1 Tax=Lemur catta TaxID=9447 RepID=UPI001E2696D3|nr:uncharacterized protein LOC123625462 isoform X2 [Lemur catta]